MKKIAILLDSTSGMTVKESEKYDNIFVMPLYVMFGEESYRDGVDFDSNGFFAKSEEAYAKDETLPTTSQPVIGECIDMYEKLLKDFDEVVYITISEKMSGTYQSGVLAAEDFDGKVTVVNSMTTAFGTYIPALIASKMVKEGSSVEDVIAMLHKTNEESKMYFVVSDLKHLQRTGRIGAAAATIGTALQLKPVLTIANGEVTQFEKVRNIKKAHKKVASYFTDMDITDNDIICIGNASADEYVEFISNEIKELFPNANIIVKDLSPVISNNTGPGTIGLFIFKNIGKIEV